MKCENTLAIIPISDQQSKLNIAFISSYHKIQFPGSAQGCHSVSTVQNIHVAEAGIPSERKAILPSGSSPVYLCEQQHGGGGGGCPGLSRLRDVISQADSSLPLSADCVTVSLVHQHSISLTSGNLFSALDECYEQIQFTARHKIMHASSLRRWHRLWGGSFIHLLE